DELRRSSIDSLPYKVLPWLLGFLMMFQVPRRSPEAAFVFLAIAKTVTRVNAKINVTIKLAFHFMSNPSLSSQNYDQEWKRKTPTLFIAPAGGNPCAEDVPPSRRA